MTRTVGSTSKSHAVSRYIAVDDDAPGDESPIASNPAHAAIFQRIVRNSNWQESRVRQTIISHAWPEDETTILDKSSANQVRIRRAGDWSVFGPWLVASARRTVVFQFGYGAEANAEVQYYFELMSENRDERWTPGSNEYSTNTTGGSAAYVDSAEVTKRIGNGPVDFVRLWVRGPESGTPTLTDGSTAGLIAGTEDGAHGGANFVCKTGGGAYIPWAQADFDGYAISVVFFEGQTPATDAIAYGPRPVVTVLESERADNQGENTMLVVWAPPDSPEFETFVQGKAFQLRTSQQIQLRYLLCYEAALSTVDDDDDTRAGFVPMDDEMANTGERFMRHILTTAQGNADAIQSSPQIVVNHCGQIFADRQLHNGRIVGPADTTYATLESHGCFLEHGHEKIMAMFWYSAQGSSHDMSMEARLRLVNPTTQVEIETSDDFGFDILTGTRVGPGDDLGLSPWSHSAWWNFGSNLIQGPLMTWNLATLAAGSKVGVFEELELQVRRDASGGVAARIAIYIHSLHVWSVP